MLYKQEVLQRPRLRERTKYSKLSAIHMFFFPVAVETLGPLSDEAHSLIAEIGRRATICTADSRNYVPLTYLVTYLVWPRQQEYPQEALGSAD